jgi:plasmid stabilization system protein ParE
MTFLVHIASNAKEDQREAIRWYAENYSENFAKRWSDGIECALESLAENPHRCGLVHENRFLSVDCRQLLYGKSKKSKHRIVFTIEEKTVYVLRIRHSAQKDLKQTDLPGPNA